MSARHVWRDAAKGDGEGGQERGGGGEEGGGGAMGKWKAELNHRLHQMQ